MGTGAVLYSLLINACEKQLGYNKQLILLHDAVPVNGTCAVGDKGPPPSLARGLFEQLELLALVHLLQGPTEKHSKLSGGSICHEKYNSKEEQGASFQGTEDYR
jgi:hypothetical protein